MKEGDYEFDYRKADSNNSNYAAQSTTYTEPRHSVEYSVPQEYERSDSRTGRERGHKVLSPIPIRQNTHAYMCSNADLGVFRSPRRTILEEGHWKVQTEITLSHHQDH